MTTRIADVLAASSAAVAGQAAAAELVRNAATIGALGAGVPTPAASSPVTVPLRAAPAVPGG